MTKLNGFLSLIEEELDKSLFIVACSGRKRSDYEACNIVTNMRDVLKHMYRYNIVLPEHLSRKYMECVLASGKPQLDSESSLIPAFIRYNGVFYDTVWRTAGFEPWINAATGKGNVLILSALYGFIQPFTGIKMYNIRLSDVPGYCKRFLRQILERIILENGFEKTYFLTSKTYYAPFYSLKQRHGIYRVKLLDHEQRVILGRYGSDYYREAGLLFTTIFTGKKIIGGKAEYVELE